MRKSDLPFGSEFSPSQIQLATVLEMAHTHGGDWKAFEDVVRLAYFEQRAEAGTNEYNRRKLANNTRLSMIAYGIIDRDANLTEFGRALHALKDDDGPRLYQELARRILLSLNGALLVQCVQDIEASGETVDLIKLRAWLGERGVHFPRGGKHPSIMRLWLEKAGVFSKGWNVDEAKLEEVMGKPTEELGILSGFTPEQRAYLKTLVNIGATSSHLSNDIEKLATATYGVKFNEKNLPKSVLYPLRDAGYIALERGTAEGGRGAKPFMVTPTNKLVVDLLLPLLEQMEKQTHNELRPLLRKPLTDVLAELKHEEKHVRGLALEALVLKLMRLIDLTYIYTRLRGTQTGGAEVDVIFEGARLVFSRWQIQCKNTDSVSLDDVAKEVGLALLLRSNVIAMVTTGVIGPEAQKYANKIMQESNLCIAMINGADIQNIAQNPAAIVDVLNREAKYAMKLKALEL